MNFSRPALKSYHPFYLVLLPVFFVLHGFVENYGFVPAYDALLVLFSYLFMTAAILLFSYFFFRNWQKAALITFIWLCFFFFFGAVHEFLKKSGSIRFLGSYRFLLPLCILVLVLVFIYLKTSEKRFKRFSWFINSLLVIYIIVDIANVIWKAFHPSDAKLAVYGQGRNEFKACNECPRPDIYFLLFDEYASSESLRDKFNFQNDLDTFLLSKNFSIQSKSHANYNFTIFSMSSILNMSYVDGIKNHRAVTAEDYGNGNILIRDNKVIQFLDVQGYDIINYSMFDLSGHPTMVQQSLLPLKTKLITDRTLFARMNKDIGWLLMTRFPFNLFTKSHYLRHRDNDFKFIDLVKNAPGKKARKPRFIYAHFNMPHVPFFYDGKGNLKDRETIHREFVSSPPEAYVDYIRYTNTHIKKIVDTITGTDPNAVIIIMGDHGFRTATSEKHPYYHFQNMNAVYYPDGNYKLLYDSISGVNQFRTVFNTLFNQTFPRLKDTTIFLVDKQ